MDHVKKLEVFLNHFIEKLCYQCLSLKNDKLINEVDILKMILHVFMESLKDY